MKQKRKYINNQNLMEGKRAKKSKQAIPLCEKWVRGRQKTG